jgi:hypothetical protein
MENSKNIATIVVIIVTVAITAATAVATTTIPTAQAQLIGPFTLMDEDSAKIYIEEQLGAEENSTAAEYIREYSTMDAETEAFIKEYLISTIRNNLTTMVVTIDEYGHMAVNSEIIQDYASDDITMEVDTTPFTEENGYKFELGRILYPNGTQFLPR